MIYLSAALVTVALLAWDFGRRWLAGEGDDDRAANARQHTAHRTILRALEERLDAHSHRLNAIDKRAAEPVDVAEFRAELDKHERALKTVFEDVRDNFARKDDLKKLEEGLRASQSAIVATGNVGNGRMRMPLR